MHDLVSAQHDMRHRYLSGGIGIFVSSMAWAAAAATAAFLSPAQSVWALFIGGMLISPVSDIICRFLGAHKDAGAANPLLGVAMASTFWLIFSLPIAYAVSQHRLEWFFPAMLLTIGGRYLTFGLLFGMRLYWVLGFTLAAAAGALVYAGAPAATGALAGSVIEFAFAAAALWLHYRWRGTVNA